MTHPRLLALSLLVSIAGTACGAGPELPAAAEPAAVATTAAARPIDACDVDVPLVDAGLTLHATGDGLLVGHSEVRGSVFVLDRALGEGCALTPAPAPFPATGIAPRTFDDLGNAYAESGPLPGVVRIDAHGITTDVVSGGRWTEWFAVSADGTALAITGCGPTGLYVLGGHDTWNVVEGSPSWFAGLPDAVVVHRGLVALDGAELVRIDGDGRRALGSAAVDFGHGDVTPLVIDRCGDDVCGLFHDGVALWSGVDGSLVRAIARSDLGVADDEQLVQVTGDRRGLYVLLRGATAARAVFVR